MRHEKALYKDQQDCEFPPDEGYIEFLGGTLSFYLFTLNRDNVLIYFTYTPFFDPDSINAKHNI